MYEEAVLNSLREAVAIACEPAEVFPQFSDPEQRHDMIVCTAHMFGSSLELWADSEGVDDPEDLQWRFCLDNNSYDLHHLPAILLNALVDLLSAREDEIRDIHSAMAWASVRAGGYRCKSGQED